MSGNGPAPQREAVLIEHLWEFKNIPPSEGVRTSEWKYLRYINDRAIEELYHLGEDPRELRNLAQDPAFAIIFNFFASILNFIGQIAVLCFS